MTPQQIAKEVDWRECPRFPGYYVSSDGLVKNTKGKQLKPRFQWNGYARVTLRLNGRAKGATVHSLVLEAFKGPRPLGYVAAHLDGKNTNNSVQNLKWTTPKENENHKWAHGTKLAGERNHQSKLKSEEIIYIRENLIPAIGSKAGNAGQLADRFGITRIALLSIARGTSWKHLHIKKAKCYES